MRSRPGHARGIRAHEASLYASSGLRSSLLPVSHGASCRRESRRFRERSRTLQESQKGSESLSLGQRLNSSQTSGASGSSRISAGLSLKQGLLLRSSSSSSHPGGCRMASFHVDVGLLMTLLASLHASLLGVWFFWGQQRPAAGARMTRMRSPRRSRRRRRRPELGKISINPCSLRSFALAPWLCPRHGIV